VTNQILAFGKDAKGTDPRLAGSLDQWEAWRAGSGSLVPGATRKEHKALRSPQREEERLGYLEQREMDAWRRGS